MDNSTPLRRPSPSGALTKPAQVDRNVFCTLYDRCLDDAVKNNWLGFTCRNCSAYQQIEINEAWIQTDSDKCKGLVMAMFENKMNVRHANYVAEMLRGRRNAELLEESWLLESSSVFA